MPSDVLEIIFQHSDRPSDIHFGAPVVPEEYKMYTGWSNESWTGGGDLFSTSKN